jgi:hypothetical protein
MWGVVEVAVVEEGGRGGGQESGAPGAVPP